jgi:hypothetical protein
VIIPAPALTAAMLLHVTGRALGAGYDTEEIHLHDAGEVFEVVVEEPLQWAADAGVVEHDVQAAEPLGRHVDEMAHLLQVAHIGLLERHGVGPVLGGHLLAGLGVHVGDDHSGSLGHEDLDGGPADTAHPAGHDGHLAIKDSRFHQSNVMAFFDARRKASLNHF